MNSAQQRGYYNRFNYFPWEPFHRYVFARKRGLTRINVHQEHARATVTTDMCARFWIFLVIRVYFFSLFASIIHSEICLMGIPVFSARCFGERFAKSEIFFTPTISRSRALLGPIPLIFVKFDLVSDERLSLINLWISFEAEAVAMRERLVFLLTRNTAADIMAPKTIPFSKLLVKKEDCENEKPI